jgi:triacylglycerol lipase
MLSVVSVEPSKSRRVALWAICIVSSVAACSTEDPETDDGATYVTTGVTGATHAATTTSGPSTGAWSDGSGAGGTGGEGPGGAPYPIVLAHGFFGFEDFAGAGFLTYFYGVKDDLAAHGETMVYTPAVDPFNDSTYRGAQLEDAIEQILAETGKNKVVIIGHSQGGLDARVVAHDRPDLVAAVVTVATPHQGAKVADVVLQLLSDPNWQDAADDLVQLIGAPLYDQVGNETSVVKPLKLFSQPGIAAFNQAYPDAPGVFYASITGRTDMTYGGQACVPDVTLPFVAALETERDPTEPLLWVSEAITDGDGSETNDGLVSVASGKHGEFWGCIPADHMDEVGQIGGDSPGLGNPFDHKAFYRDLIGHIRDLGY